MILSVNFHTNDIENLSHEEIKKEINTTEQSLLKGDKWLHDNLESNYMYDVSLERFISLVNRRAALDYRLNESKQLNLF